MSRQRSRPKQTRSAASPVNRARQMKQIRAAQERFKSASGGAKWGRVGTKAGNALLLATTALELVGVGVAVAGEVGDLAKSAKDRIKPDSD